jgi:hypothetical protein
MTDFKAIAGINFTFAFHRSPMAQTGFIDNYGGHIPDPDALFTDNSKTDLKDNVVDLILNQFIDDMIIPVATQTADVTAISPLVKSCQFQVSYGNKQGTRLTKKSLRDTMTNVIAAKFMPAVVDITVIFSHLLFPFEPSFLDWSVFLSVPGHSHARSDIVPKGSCTLRHCAQRCWLSARSGPKLTRTHSSNTYLLPSIVARYCH